MNVLTDKNKIAIETYNKIADLYSNKYFKDLSDIPYIDKFLSKLPPKGKVLDVGCGPGMFTDYLMKQGFQVEGIDLSSEMIKIARKKVPKGDFKIMDMRNLEYESKSFDGLLTAYSLIHIPEKDLLTTLKEFQRVLKPNGHMLIIAQKGKADKIVEEPFKKGERMFINFFTSKRLSDSLKNAGFKIVFIKEDVTSDPDAMSRRIIYAIGRKAS